MSKLLQPKEADYMYITAYIVPSKQIEKKIPYPLDISVAEFKKEILSEAQLQNSDDYQLFYGQVLIPHDRKLCQVINTKKTKEAVVLIQNCEVKMTFKFHQTNDNVRIWELDVEITRTFRDIKSDVIQRMKGSRHLPIDVEDICFSQGDRIIHENISPVGEVTGDQNLEYYPPVGTYNVHVLPEGSWISVSLIPTNPGGKNYVVILSEDATVREFREEAAKMLQQSPGKLHFSGERAYSGVADAKTRGEKRKRSAKDSSQGDKTFDFLQSPEVILSGWEDHLEIVIEKKMDDGPPYVQKRIVHYDVDTKECPMTVNISVSGEEKEVNCWNGKVHKFDSFSSLQKRIGDEYDVDSRLVHFSTEKGRRIQSVHEADFKTVHIVKATVFKNGTVLTLKHHENLFTHTCVVKDKEKVTVHDIRRNVERELHLNCGMLRLAQGDNSLKEEAYISSLGLMRNEELLLRPATRKDPPEHSAPASSPRRLHSPGDSGRNQRLRTNKRQHTSRASILEGVPTTPAETCSSPRRDTSDETESAVERVQLEEASPPVSTDQRPEVQPTPGSHRDVEVPTPTSHEPLPPLVGSPPQVTPYSPAPPQSLPGHQSPAAATSDCRPTINEDTCTRTGSAEMSPLLPAAQANGPGMIEHSWTRESTFGGVSYFRETWRSELNPAIATLPPELLQALQTGSYPSAPTQLAITHGPALPGVVTDQILWIVAEMLSEEWYALCIHLQVPSSELNHIRSNHGTSKEWAFAGLSKWKTMRGRHATNAALKKALEEKELMSIAEQIPSEDGNPL